MDLAQWAEFQASFSDYRWLAWPFTIVAMTWILYQQAFHFEGRDDRPVGDASSVDSASIHSAMASSAMASTRSHLSQPAGLWVWAFSALAWVAATLVLQLAQWQTLLFAKDHAWGIAAVGVALSLLLGLVLRVNWSERLRGHSIMKPIHVASFNTQVPTGLAWLLGFWFIFACTSDYGGVAIKPFIPLLNPVDLSASLALLSLVAFSRSSVFARLRMGGEAIAQRHVQIALSLAAFLLLNTLLMRALSHYLDLPYRVTAMLDSSTAQTAFSLLWAITATAIMFFATRRAWRSAWLVGAALLGLVVVKLFLIDLSTISALTRIISFVGVGLLMLLIGYLSPLPPAAEKKSVVT